MCAARRVRSRAASISTADCAIISRMSWKSPIGRPKALRSLAYFVAASSAARATPTAPAAIPILPLFRVRIAWFQPSPRFPIKFSFGTRQSSKARSAVGLPQSELCLRLDVGDLEPTGVLGDHEERDSLVSFRSRFAGIHLDEIREVAVRDESLLAVQHPLVPVEPCRRLQVPGVAPRLGFRDRPRPEPFAFGERHEPFALLRLAREPHEGRLR